MKNGLSYSASLHLACSVLGAQRNVIVVITHIFTLAVLQTIIEQSGKPPMRMSISPCRVSHTDKVALTEPNLSICLHVG